MKLKDYLKILKNNPDDTERCGLVHFSVKYFEAGIAVFGY